MQDEKKHSQKPEKISIQPTSSPKNENNLHQDENSPLKKKEKRRVKKPKNIQTRNQQVPMKTTDYDSFLSSMKLDDLFNSSPFSKKTKKTTIKIRKSQPTDPSKDHNAPSSPLKGKVPLLNLSSDSSNSD